MLDRFERFSLSIFEITRYWHKLTNDEMKKHGLKGPHAIYLTTMYRHPEGITVPRLCELCGKDKSDASRMLAILEKKGMIRKLEVDGSLYRGLVVLTDKGAEAAEQVCSRAGKAVELAGKDLGEENRAIFYAALDSVSRNLRKLSDEGIPE